MRSASFASFIGPAVAAGFLLSWTHNAACAADASQSAAAVAVLETALAGGASLQDLAEQAFAKVPLTKADAEQARELLWRRHASHLRKERASEVDARRLRDDKLEMPFFLKVFGEEPKTGRSLWISLHG